MMISYQHLVSFWSVWLAAYASCQFLLFIIALKLNYVIWKQNVEKHHLMAILYHLMAMAIIRYMNVTQLVPFNDKQHRRKLTSCNSCLELLCSTWWNNRPYANHNNAYNKEHKKTFWPTLRLWISGLFTPVGLFLRLVRLANPSSFIYSTQPP